MNPDLEHLVVLQAQDLELRRLRAELAEGPQRIASAEKAVAEASSSLEGLRAALAGEEKQRRTQDLEIQSQQTKLTRLRGSLAAATSAQQVSAFGNEITFTEAAIARAEEQAFASLERTEELQGQQPAAEKSLHRAQTVLTTEQERVQTTAASHREAVEGIERERSGLRATVTPQWLATYDRLAKARGTAVAEALGNSTAGKCAACQMGVRPQRWQDLTGRDHLDEIFACESCGRLLFWDPRRDTPKPWLAGERLGAAQAAAAGSGQRPAPARQGGAR